MLTKAVGHHRSGDLEAAERLYRLVLQAEPNQVDALNLLGVIMLSRGKAADAVRLIGQAAGLRPREPSILSNLGNALKSAGKIDDAHRRYREALTWNPRFSPALINLGVLLAEAGRPLEAIPLLQTAVAVDRRSVEAHLGLAEAFRLAERTSDAESSYREALKLDPKLAPAATRLASMLAAQDRFAEAYALHDQALAVDPRSADYLGALAQTAYREGDLDRTIATYRRSLEHHPTSGAQWNELGRALRAFGDFEDARACFRRALACDPALVDARRNIALIGDRDGNGEEAELRALASDPQIAEMDRVLAGFTLGKICDDGARYDDAFTFYAQANALRKAMYAREGQVFDRDHFGHMITEATETKPPPGVVEASPSDVPVFVVGMPRSGTSLVEQVLASHASVIGAGELSHIKALTDALATGDAVLATRQMDRVLSRLQSLAGGARRVIDKMPDNVWHLRTIERCFPQARIIFCTRDPLDTCLSCFFQLFSSGNLFSYDLQDCGIRQLGTEQVIAHSMATSNLRWTSVAYESLVDNLEAESRRLLDFLDLPWDESCLTFYETRRAVRTASGWQVRQHLYSSSAGRWRHYRHRISDLAAMVNS